MSISCDAPTIQYDPACDHGADPVEHALYIVADNVAKHTMSGKFWDCQDACWQEALTEARTILRAEIARARHDTIAD